jgi:hypothetical protein
MVNGALNNIHENALIIAYLQVGEVLVWLTTKEHDQLCIGVKWFKWECNSFLRMYMDEWMWVVLHPKQHKGLVPHVHELGHFRV